MSEIEIPEVENGDTFGKWIGVATAILGLCVVASTIIGHKAHDASMKHQLAASDKWSEFQAKKIRAYESGITTSVLESTAPLLEASGTLLTAAGATHDKQAADLFAKAAEKKQQAAEFTAKKTGYEADAKAAMAEAKEYEHHSHIEHAKGDRLDMAEGMFELAVILCSLYFLSKKKLLPVMGFAAAAFAAVMFGWAFFGPALTSADAKEEVEAPPTHAQVAPSGEAPPAH